jgi:2-haloacid dehalogenase
MANTEYKALFFDADDTLFDYVAAERAALTDAMERFAVKTKSEPFIAAYRRHNGDVWKEFESGRIDQVSLREERFRRVATELGEQLPVAELSAFYLERLSRQTMLIDGALTMLKTVSRRYPLALVTNGIAQVQRPRFTASLLHRYFAVVVISEESGYAKPDPRIFDGAFAMLRVKPEDVLYIGDSISSDMAAAGNAGIDFCWFNPDGVPHPGTLPTRWTIRSWSELPPLLMVSD